MGGEPGTPVASAGIDAARVAVAAGRPGLAGMGRQGSRRGPGRGRPEQWAHRRRAGTADATALSGAISGGVCRRRRLATAWVSAVDAAAPGASASRGTGPAGVRWHRTRRRRRRRRRTMDGVAAVARCAWVACPARRRPRALGPLRHLRRPASRALWDQRGLRGPPPPAPKETACAVGGGRHHGRRRRRLPRGRRRRGAPSLGRSRPFAMGRIPLGIGVVTVLPVMGRLRPLRREDLGERLDRGPRC